MVESVRVHADKNDGASSLRLADQVAAGMESWRRAQLVSSGKYSISATEKELVCVASACCKGIAWRIGAGLRPTHSPA